MYTKKRSSSSTSYTYIDRAVDASAKYECIHVLTRSAEVLIEESESTISTNVYKYVYAHLYGVYKTEILFISIIQIHRWRCRCKHNAYTC
jgi:hypothetical protein